jgi:hypothetical protein
MKCDESKTLGDRRKAEESMRLSCLRHRFGLLSEELAPLTEAEAEDIAAYVGTLAR